jgi:hypothetical protein
MGEFMKKNYATHFVVGALLLWGVAYASINANYPKIYSPYSFIVIMPILALHEIFRSGHLMSYLLGTLITPLLFLLWSVPLLSGQIKIPKRSKIIAILLVLLSLLLLVGSWSSGIQYQGVTYTIAIYALNLFFWTVLIFLYRSNKIRASYTSNYLFHWILFAWLGWVAFPWLGELL